MSDEATEPVIFISYAHEDDEWLSFVQGFLGPGVKAGLFRVWTDRLIKGGADWNPEIEKYLRACHIFILLVSTYSMGSDFIVDREIAIIRERQAKGEPVHFYPLHVTPTPDAGLERVNDKNLRPSREKSFLGCGACERLVFMKEAADEIAGIARDARVRTSEAGADLHIDGRTGFKMRFKDQKNPVGDCVELIPKARWDSAYEIFHLMPDLLCGTKREWKDNIYHFFRIRELALQLKLNDRDIAPLARRLGHRGHQVIDAEGNRTSIRAEGNKTWIITADKNKVLSGQVIGPDDVLCSISPLKKGGYNIIMEVWCLQRDIIHDQDNIIHYYRQNHNKESIVGIFINICLEIACDFMPGGKRKQNRNKESVHDIFINQCLGSQGGFVTLCSADFDVEEDLACH
jgi:hypothetical protein